MTLTEFLLARIAEDEARASGARSWMERRPAEPRVLAECEAKRQIVESYNAMDDTARQWDDIHHGRMVALEDDVLPRLAAVYADHPDYSEGLRP